ncbi:MAG: GspE/PulE family protein [Patescibacteria group bacterium]|jgi:type IV pilus assembly protein PilB|nr:GspE/PulE family protein [Patescibacteria group bacterium]
MYNKNNEKKYREILELLVEEGLVKSSQAKTILNKANKENKTLSRYLIEKDVDNEEKLTKIKAKYYKLPYYNLLEEEVPDTILKFLPEEVSKTYKIICFDRVKNVLKMGLVEPNLKAMEAVTFLISGEKLQVEYYLISETSFKKVFKQYQKIEEEISSALELRAREDGEELVEVNEEAENLSKEDINSAPVSRIVSVIIRHAVEARASDIHIEPFAKQSRVRYRIDGILHTSLSLPKNVHNAIVSRIKVLAKLKLDETRIPQDGRIRLVVNNREVDFRISTLPLIGSEKVVMRILDTAKGAPELEELGFNNLALRRIRNGLKKTGGIFLVTGPTGSGKTTTLYSALTILNQEGVNISTLEDPIEYEIKGVNQSQVRPKVGFSFASGLRSLLRQDPDIIMVGEIRDEETAELSIHASLTGHLVLSSLHTNNALGAIFRLIDMKIEHFLLSSTLKTVIAQRLTRRLCVHCKKPLELTKEAREEVKSELDRAPFNVLKEEFDGLDSVDDIIEKHEIYKAVGCSYCDETGYSDRIAISEVIDINDDLKSAINNEEEINIDVVKEYQDFISIKQDGMIKVLKGVTTLEEVLRVIED